MLALLLIMAFDEAPEGWVKTTQSWDKTAINTSDIIDMAATPETTHLIIYDIMGRELAVIETHSYPETIKIDNPAWIRAYSANRLQYQVTFRIIEPILLNMLTDR
jgi:hypothetical protein